MRTLRLHVRSLWKKSHDWLVMSAMGVWGRRDWLVMSAVGKGGRHWSKWTLARDRWQLTSSMDLWDKVTLRALLPRIHYYINKHLIAMGSENFLNEVSLRRPWLGIHSPSSLVHPTLFSTCTRQLKTLLITIMANNGNYSELGTTLRSWCASSHLIAMTLQRKNSY